MDIIIYLVIGFTIYGMWSIWKTEKAMLLDIKRKQKRQEKGV